MAPQVDADAKPVLAVSPTTIGMVALEILGGELELPQADQKAVAELTANLFDELASLRSFDVGEAEPAHIYHADGAS